MAAEGADRDGPVPGEPDAPPRGVRGVYMISVAAELSGMHPQTLRIYETRGLVQPKRSSGNTRLYSEEDVARLRRIQELTTELGMNLAGVERVFALEQELTATRRRMASLERRAERAVRALEDQVEELRRANRAELVPYEPPGAALVPVGRRRPGGVRVRVERPG